MAEHKPVKVDKKEIEKAEKLWSAFGVATKWTTIFVIAILIGLAIAFL